MLPPQLERFIHSFRIGDADVRADRCEAVRERPGVSRDVVSRPGRSERVRVSAQSARQRLAQEHRVLRGRGVVDQRSEQIEDDGPARHLARMHVRRTSVRLFL